MVVAGNHSQSCTIFSNVLRWEVSAGKVNYVGHCLHVTHSCPQKSMKAILHTSPRNVMANLNEDFHVDKSLPQIRFKIDIIAKRNENAVNASTYTCITHTTDFQPLS